MNKQQIMALKNCPVGDNMTFDASNNALYSASSSNTIGSSITKYFDSTTAGDYTCWGYWQDHYYPTIIRESYPVYISERAKDKGRQAFEIIKILKDKKLIKMDKVGDFIDLMDELIKIL